MSRSFTHDGQFDRGDAAAPGGSLDEQLAAEIADHLAASAADLMRRGQTPDQAANLALERFGDVASIKRKCWWIHKGEQVMFRTAGIVLLTLLTIGVGIVCFAGWQFQRNFVSRTDELSEQLASLTATQQAMLTQQRPPEITGTAYLGDPSTPAKDVEIQVFRFSEVPTADNAPTGVITRRLRTDAQGRFDSGILQAGEYCLLGPLLDPQGQANEQLFPRLQSRPLYLTAGIGKSTVDLNLLASGCIRLGVMDIPNSITVGATEVRVFVQMHASTDGVPYFERRPVPPSDKPPRDGWPLPLPAQQNNIGAAMQRPADLPRDLWLPPRKYALSLSLSFWSPEAETSAFGSQVVYTKFVPLNLELAADDAVAITLEVLGESLQERFEAALQENMAAAEKDISKMVGLIPFMQSVAKEVELKASLTRTDTQQ